VLDCPHGNAWFFPWHRGYLYWFECIARKLTGNPNFAVPYWDVTKSAIMPSFFFRGDLLDTTAKGYVHDLEEFRALLHEPLRKYWATLSPRQLEQLKRRNWNTFDQFWVGLTAFIVRDTWRDLTQANPSLPLHVQDAVSMNNLVGMLAPKDFFDFGGALTNHHYEMTRNTSNLEGQLHNLVHDGVGGYMGDMLSATDPIFWLHHGNVDRLWDIWLDRQGLTRQDGPPKWRDEPFLFFCDENGQPVDSIAGDYVSSAELGYTYEPSIPIPVAASSFASRSSFTLDADSLQIGGGEALARVSPGAEACDAFRRNCQTDVLIALDRPHDPASLYFQIEMRVINGVKPYTFKHCGYASFFGSMGHQSPSQPPHVGGLRIGITEGMKKCLEELGEAVPGALDFEVSVRLRSSRLHPIPLPTPLKIREMTLISV
jgi:hypothetical protein